MTYLGILDLHENQLNGSIPSNLGNLSQLHFVELSVNSLSGPIPDSLGNLKNLTHFNVSYNKLAGTIPSSLQHFGYSAFFHNQGLCGPPLDISCSGHATSRKPKFSASAIIAIVAAVVILTGVCVITIVNMKVRRRRRDNEAVLSLPSKYEDWEAGTKALLDKECVIGGGSIGTVYRTNFEGGITIAVKKLETLGRIRNQDEFEHEIGRLGNIRHPNLVAFQGYYWSTSMQLILSEFVPNGNLYDNLHGLNYPGTSTDVGNPELNWPRRFRIALGTARALAYLHHDCKPPVLHLNINLRGFAENELVQVMKLGLICTSETPSRRPNMGEIVQILESIRSGID
ncbi:hypothetical protein C3L33_00422, partial [Rhododendron williamsianum]